LRLRYLANLKIRCKNIFTETLHSLWITDLTTVCDATRWRDDFTFLQIIDIIKLSALEAFQIYSSLEMYKIDFAWGNSCYPTDGLWSLRVVSKVAATPDDG